MTYHFSNEYSSTEESSDYSSDASSDESDADLAAHLSLLGASAASDHVGEVMASPIFTEAVRKHGVRLAQNDQRRRSPFTQYGLLAGVVDGSSHDPRLFYNITAPNSVFICGSQGSGKSHTLSCLLENCLLPSKANVLPRPLTGIVFHYDTFVSDSGGAPCEAAYLSSKEGIKVRVLCSPTNIKQMENIYSNLPNVTVQPLHLDQTDLNTKRMLDLMAVNSMSGDSVPLYVHVVIRVLRELRLKQQISGGDFDYNGFRAALENEQMVRGQNGPLNQRLDTLESFMVNDQVRKPVAGRPQAKIKRTPKNSIWKPKAGQLTVVDLSCPCITPEMACSLFNICLSLFLEQDSEIGRVVALDEAHKYMTDSAECKSLTESLLSTIRLQRHLAARIFISTQEPTISPKLLDLCTVTIVHRFTSPAWLTSLKGHLAGASHLAQAELLNHGSDSGIEDDLFVQGATALPMKNSTQLVMQLFSNIVALKTGEALMFAPSAVIGLRQAKDAALGLNSLSLGGQNSRLQETVFQFQGSDSANSAPSKKTQPKENLDNIETIRLGHGVLKIRVRQRVTLDGGRSVMAQ